MDRRGNRVVFVAHCILNQNAVVYGLASREGIVKEIVDLLYEKGIGLVQMPCPELSYAGSLRFWQSREQYDSVGFRRHCRLLAELQADLALELERGGCRVLAVIGIKGSPSCGVSETFSANWRGDPRRAEPGAKVRREGVFIEELEKAFRSRGLAPAFVDVDHRELEESIERLEEVLEA